MLKVMKIMSIQVMASFVCTINMSACPKSCDNQVNSLMKIWKAITNKIQSFRKMKALFIGHKIDY